MAISCINVDDEPAALDLVKSYIAKTSFLELKGSFHNPIEALDFATTNEVQLLFLDINMPDLSGMELSKMLNRNTKVIFTTAYDEYAIEGYKVNALDYLLKPFSYEEFLTSVLRAKAHFSAAQPEEPSEQFIFIKADYKLQKIAFDDLLFVEGMKDYVRFHLSDGRKFMPRMSMRSLMDVLPAKFMRVHRSYIVALDAIELVERNRIIIGKEYIPIAENYREDFKAYLDRKTFDGK